MKIGIALGGGGAKGFALIGILEALDEAGVEAEIVAGTSIGALVGAAYAANKLPELKQRATTLSFLNVVKILSPTISRSGFCSGRGVESLLKEFIDIENIEDLPKPFATLSTALETGELITATNGNLIKAVRSSIAIPGLFTPVLSNEKTLVDPVPVEACRSLGADFVIAVDLFADLPKRPKKKFTLSPLMENCVGIAQKQLTQARFAKHPPNFLLEPDTSSVSILAFHRGEALIQIGKNTISKALPSLNKALGREASKHSRTSF